MPSTLTTSATAELQAVKTHAAAQSASSYMQSWTTWQRAAWTLLESIVRRSSVVWRARLTRSKLSPPPNP